MQPRTQVTYWIGSEDNKQYKNQTFNTDNKEKIKKLYREYGIKPDHIIAEYTYREYSVVNTISSDPNSFNITV